MREPIFVEAYKLFRDEAHKSIELHATHFQNFLTLLIAIAGGTLAVFEHFGTTSYTQGLMLFVGGYSGLVASVVG